MDALLLAGLHLFVAVPAAPAAAPAPAAPVQESQNSEFGAPLVVNGVRIPDDDIKRYLIYGVGRPALEWRKIEAMLDHEEQARIAAGMSPELFVVTDEEFQAKRDQKIEEFREKYPNLDVETEIRRAYRTIPWWERELRQEMRFDKILIPDNPADWPDVTFEALRAEAGDVLINDFQASYERRANHYANELAEWEAKKAAGEDPGPEPQMPEEDGMYRSILRQIVRDAMFKVIDIKSAIDGLPSDIVTTMDFDFDGKPEHVWTTQEIWEDIRDTLSEKDIEDARLFLAKVAATRQRMEGEGFLIGPEEAKEAFQEVSNSFSTSPFNLGAVAVNNQQFPSLESYAEYFTLLESWKRHLEPMLAPPPEGGIAQPLRDHLDRANRIMGLAQVDCEVLFIGAFDPATYRWLENGWEKAREEAEWVKAEYDRNAAAYADWRKRRMEAAARGEELAPEEGVLPPEDFWSLLIDEHCDFWDPPPPDGSRGSAVGYKQNGRFGERYRNDLQSLMDESPFLHFLNGKSLTDHVFFEQEVGTVDGPFKGTFGYYLTRVKKRTPPSRPLNLQNERHVELLKNDYISYSLIGYAQEALEQADVKGL